MGTCIFCNRPAGFFRRDHKDCRVRFDEGTERLCTVAQSVLKSSIPLSDADESAGLIVHEYGLSQAARDTVLVDVWSTALADFADDGVVTREEEKILSDYRRVFGLSQDQLDKNGAYTRLIQALVLRDVEEDGMSSRFDAAGFSLINFQKTEKLIWIFSNVDYIEERTRREYVGGSSGFSVRVAKGVYLRQSAYRGQSVDRVESIHVDTGYAAFTDRHIYFSGPRKAWRTPYRKIISLTPYSDGLGIMKDAGSAKPQTLVTGDGVFAYNLAQALAQRV
jgi:hypothetical protein